jgi:hypothetical protein
MFFLNPDDLTNLDIANGECYNKSIPQNLTFSYQGLPLGLGKHSGAGGGLSTREVVGASSLMALVASLFTAAFMSF